MHQPKNEASIPFVQNGTVATRFSSSVAASSPLGPIWPRGSQRGEVQTKKALEAMGDDKEGRGRGTAPPPPQSLGGLWWPAWERVPTDLGKAMETVGLRLGRSRTLELLTRVARVGGLWTLDWLKMQHWSLGYAKILEFELLLASGAPGAGTIGNPVRGEQASRMSLTMHHTRYDARLRDSKTSKSSQGPLTTRLSQRREE
ncbi:hypothetical protein F4780DRAFT_124873 [Xylariomycetidae sp. FL0641]|nr:hypothetical protein F4780DRAFT_124873 [Xylariomycetidae sp. FL0641]